MTHRIVVVGEGAAADAVVDFLRGRPTLSVEVAATAGRALAAPARAAPSLIIEAAPDVPLTAKAAALAMLLGALPGVVPVAVATRIHTLDALLPDMRQTGRVVGHRPLAGTSVAEVAMPVAFDDALVDRVLDLLGDAGVVALPCADAPGRIVDRLLATVAVEARAVAFDGLATPATVAAACSVAGLSLTVLAATDVDSIVAAIHRGLGEPARFRPVGSDLPDGEASPERRVPLGVGALAERLELVAIAEAYRMVGEATAGAEEIERGLTLGAGWTAGPFTMAGRRGLRAVTTDLAALSRAPGVDAATADRFAIPPLLWQMATV